MIILDTDIVSEPMRVEADAAVLAWLDQQAAQTLFLTATSLSELLLGIHKLPRGKRKDGLDAALGALLSDLFGPRILSFDEQAAVHYARMVAQARSRGRVISVPDGQIAAIAALHGYSVATRDTTPFLDVGIRVINPWDTPA